MTGVSPPTLHTTGVAVVQEVRDTFGKWWRASRYEIKNDFIVPTDDATFEEYDPWEGFQVGTSSPPYDALFELLRALDANGTNQMRLTSAGEDLILAWCRSHGLLGVLPHRLIAAHMTPLYEPFAFPDVTVESRVDASLLAPLQRRIVRISAGWRLSATIHMAGNRSVVIVDEPERAGSRVEPEYWAKGWPQPGVMLRSLNGKDVEVQGFGGEWGSFFPSLAPDELEAYQYPHPGSIEFQRIYGEHFAVFLQTAARLQNALQLLGAGKTVKELDDQQVRLTIDANRTLNDFVLPVSQAARLEDDGVVRPIWVSPSLLATYATMILRALAIRGTRLVACEVCAKPFITTRAITTYCTERCRRTGQKRNQRRRRREEERQ